MKDGLITNLITRRSAVARMPFLALVAAFLIFPHGAAVAAKPKATFFAERMIQSEQRLLLAPDETKKFTIGFKNTGTAVWKNSGPGYLTVFTYNPKYRKSVFQDPSWRSFRQVTVMKTPEVTPGEIGFFELTLRAPASPGQYEESFALASDDAAWVERSHFHVPITVAAKAPTVVTTVLAAEPRPPAAKSLAPPNSADFQALRLTQSAPSLTLRPGEEQTFHILFKNVGLKPWYDQAIRVRDTGPLSITSETLGTLAFAHASWSDKGQPVFVRQEILPGEVSLNRFTVRAPAAPGQYLAQFILLANGAATVGGEFEIPITVTDETGNPPGTAIPIIGAIPEPLIRIGLYTADEPIRVVATEPLEVRTIEGQLLGTLERGAPVTVGYSPGYGYSAIMPNGSATVSSPIRLVPAAPAVLTITNYTNRPKWSKTINDNDFRGALELRRNSKGFTWVINELPLEQYLDGLAETSNGSPSEYHKAIIAAARTYAYWHLQNPSKHDDSGFTIDAYWDQVYRGYNSERRMGNFVASVEETRGAVVTFQNEVAITPYFARSNGRTRTWQEGWGGKVNYPWIQSLPVPWDEGSRRLGHGVGMSATAASIMAKEGQTYPEILKYFYPGTELKRLW